MEIRGKTTNNTYAVVTQWTEYQSSKLGVMSSTLIDGSKICGCNSIGQKSGLLNLKLEVRILSTAHKNLAFSEVRLNNRNNLVHWYNGYYICLSSKERGFDSRMDRMVFSDIAKIIGILCTRGSAARAPSGYEGDRWFDSNRVRMVFPNITEKKLEMFVNLKRNIS